MHTQFKQSSTPRRAACLCAALACVVGAPGWALPLWVAAMEEGGSVQVVQAAGVVFQPFGAGFSGGVRVAVADVSGDGSVDIIAGSGPGRVATVSVFDANLRPGASFQPFGPSFSGGVHVAAGDVNGDGLGDIIVSPGAGGGPVVRVFDGSTQVEIRSFTAFAGYNGGVRVAAGDINGDGRDDIIVATGGGGAQVRVFDGASGAELRTFTAFSASFAGGVYVAAGDVNGDQIADVVVGSGADPSASGGPQVKVFSGRDNAVIADFYPYAASFRGGVRVATGDVNGDGLADLITSPGSGGPAVLSRWLAPLAVYGGDLPVFTPSYVGGVQVGAPVVIQTLLRDGFD